MNILSLFDGISCARVALDKVGIKVDKYYASEIDKYAMQIAKKNYPDTVHIGSVTDVVYCDGGLFSNDVNALPTKIETWCSRDSVTIDLLIGGSPCQDLSVAKKDRKGLAGERSGLFYEYLRIRDEVKPKYFILENVASMPKEAKEEITKCLGVEPVMINASLVSAQNRKRLFWVGKRNDEGGYDTVHIPQPEDRGIFLKDILEENVDEKYFTNMNFEKRIDYTIHETPYNKKGQALRATDYKGTHNIIRVGQFNSGGQGDRVYSDERKSVTLSANGGGRGAKTGLYEVCGVALRNRGEGKRPEFNGQEKANAMTTVQTDSMVSMPPIIRKLTPTECERLQGVPDGYTGFLLPIEYNFSVNNIFSIGNVLSKIVKDIRKQKFDTVYYTIRDLKNTEQLNFQLKNIRSVKYVDGKGLQDDGVEIIITIGKDIETHYMLTISGIDSINMGIKNLSNEITELSIEGLWKTIFEDRLQSQMLFTILTELKLIMILVICIGLIGVDTKDVINLLKKLQWNYLENDILNLKIEITRECSNTQRYKCLGNGFNADVIAHIYSHLF